MSTSPRALQGFTLLELLVALLVLSILGAVSYRALGAVLDARERLDAEAEKWRRVEAFFARFERDLTLAAPRAIRVGAAAAPPFEGVSAAAGAPQLQFSRFAFADGLDVPRRVGYGLNGAQEIEVWVWAGLDVAPGARAARHTILRGVERLELEYLAGGLWRAVWPAPDLDAALPAALRIRIALASGETLERVFALR